MSGFDKKQDDWHAEESDESVVADIEEEVETDDSDAEEEEEAGNDDGGKDVEKEEVKPKNGGSKQPLSKKEKAALKQKEMEDLDDVFAEFGIDVEKSGGATEEEAVEKEEMDADVDRSGDKKKKKKKKPKAKKPEEEVAAPAISKEEARAKLLAAKKGGAGKSKVSDAVAAALRAKGEDTKKQSKSERKKAQSLDWER